MKTVNKILTVALLATITTAPIYAGGGGSGSHAKKWRWCTWRQSSRLWKMPSAVEVVLVVKNGGGVRGKYA